MDPVCQPRLLGAGEVRRLAAEIGVSPRKSLGQNFVVDGNTIRRIVRLADLEPADHVLEVGPGLGSLTLGLLGTAGHVTAVEIDRRLAAALPETIGERAPECLDRVAVVCADAAKLTDLSASESINSSTLSSTSTPGPTALVANLPYNVAVPVLLHCLAVFPSITKGLVMVQTEVGERLVAAPGESAFGVPSLKLAWFAEARMAGKVPAGVFWPVPRVESSLVGFERRQPPDTMASREDVFALINAAFGQRRKTLRSSLRAWTDREVLMRALSQAQLTGGERPEQLSLQHFVALAEVLS
jgi:16S rRNA (adenine1518-N6/adenine1519-N6)-dimethyltransferase